MISHKQDYELAQRLLAGNEGEFNAFYEEYYDRVYRFCLRRVRDRELAHDLVQQTLTRVFKYLYAYKGEASLFTWICQICRNETSDWFRQKKNQPALHITIDDDPTVLAILESEGGEEFADDLEIAQLVHLALDALTPRYSKVLQLKYLEGLTNNEISEQMNTSVLATQSVLARARDAFKTLVSDLLSESKTSIASLR